MAAFKAASKMLIPASAFLVSAASRVQLDNVTTDTAKKSDSPSKFTRPRDLPLYENTGCGCHHESQRAAVPRSKSSLEQSICELRLAITHYFTSLEGSMNRVEEVLGTAKAHTLDTVAYLREENNLPARVGAITGGALLGVLISRGGFFKKILYGNVGAAAAAAVCYPDEASKVSRRAYAIGKYYTIVGYTKLQEELNARRGNKPENKQHTATVVLDKGAKSANEEKKTNVDIQSVPVTTVKGSKVKEDYGQSNPNDRDLYTTRG